MNLYAQTFYNTGSTVDAITNPLSGILLAGGATDNDDAMRWFLQRADGGDIVVIRATGSDGYNNYLYSGLDVAVNSVTSIVIASQASADQQVVYDAMIKAEALFIAGGNQWDYVNFWKNTLVEDAIHYLVNDKGVTIGGTSAGLAVLGEVAYTAENNTVWSSEALNDPYHFRVTLDNDFLHIPFLEEVVTDSHYNRIQGDDEDRKGRHVVFMARMVMDWDMDAKGIGINEYTAVGVNEDGMARVFGNPAYEDYAYFLKVNGEVPESCEASIPLTWNHDGQALSVYKILGNPEGNNSFDLTDWQAASGGEWQNWYVMDGVLFEALDGGFYQLRFTIKHGITEAPVQGAKVELEGQEAQYTNATGVALFVDIEGGSELDFMVSRDGFLSEEGIVTVIDEHVDQVVLLYPGSDVGAPSVRTPGLSTYPNPAVNGYFNINLPDYPGKAKLRIINALGVIMLNQELQPEGSGQIRVYTSGWPSGIYMILLESPEGVWREEILTP
jgi:cyanophycinase-like exopeptidase